MFRWGSRWSSTPSTSTSSVGGYPQKIGGAFLERPGAASAVAKAASHQRVTHRVPHLQSQVFLGASTPRRVRNRLELRFELAGCFEWVQLIEHQGRGPVCGELRRRRFTAVARGVQPCVVHRHLHISQHPGRTQGVLLVLHHQSNDLLSPVREALVSDPIADGFIAWL